MDVSPITEQEISKIRSETKGTATKIHFNNAGASFPHDSVNQTIISYLEQEALLGGYEAEASHKEKIERTYSLIAELINAEKDEILLAENASSAWGLAFNGIGLKAGDEIITSEMEYVSNLLGFIRGKQDIGIVIRIIRNDENGDFQLDELEQAISTRTKLIAITHIASSTGGIMPIAAVGKIARKHNILYLVDGCQSAGHVPIDVQQINCDMFSVTGRKYLRGPRGTGFLYIRRDAQTKLNPSVMDHHSIQWITHDDYQLRNDARKFELYEKSRALGLGLWRAVEYALSIGVDRIWERIQLLAGLLRNQLESIKGVKVHDIGTLKCGIVTFSVRDVDSTLLKSELAKKNINVSIAVAAATLIFMDKNKLNSIVRASVHYYNTEDEVKTLCYQLQNIIAEQVRVAVG